MACSWLEPLLASPTRTPIVDKAVSFLKKMDFDAIAVRGMSGALIGSILAEKLDKELIVVRKPSEDGHSSYMLEYSREMSGSYIIVDDFICEGITAKIIRDVVEKDAGLNLQYAGIYLYLIDEPNDTYRFWRTVTCGEKYNVLNAKLCADEYVAAGELTKYRGLYYRTSSMVKRILPGVKL